jgi:drug/metabolite transporter (DMT)-like permease
MLLDESFRPLLLAGTVLIVLGSVTLAGERIRPEHLRARGFVLATLCAALFAARDNLIRLAARNEHPPPLVAATASLLAAAALILVYLALIHRDQLRTSLRQAVPAFAPAGIAIALGYDALLAALDRGRVSVVSPLNATGSLWAVLFAALVIGRSEYIGRRVTSAALLVVAGERSSAWFGEQTQRPGQRSQNGPSTVRSRRGRSQGTAWTESSSPVPRAPWADRWSTAWSKGIPRWWDSRGCVQDRTDQCRH